MAEAEAEAGVVQQILLLALVELEVVAQGLLGLAFQSPQLQAQQTLAVVAGVLAVEQVQTLTQVALAVLESLVLKSRHHILQFSQVV